MQEPDKTTTFILILNVVLCAPEAHKDGYPRPRRDSLSADMYYNAGFIFNAAFGQNRFGAPQKLILYSMEKRIESYA